MESYLYPGHYDLITPDGKVTKIDRISDTEIEAVVAIEEISRVDVTLGVLLNSQVSVVSQELFNFGSEEQKQKYLVPLMEGNKIGAFALTEPDAGSDAASILTLAVRHGDEWILNGTKQFISNIGLENASIALTAI